MPRFIKLLPLLLLCLLCSCSKDDEYRLVIMSPNSSTAFIFSDDKGASIHVDSDTLRMLSELSGLDDEESLMAIFPDFDYYKRGYKEAREVSRILTILERESGGLSLPEALRLNEKIIEKSRLLDKIDSLSDNIDEKRLLQLVALTTSWQEYELKNVVSSQRDFEENRAFIENWLEYIVR